LASTKADPKRDVAYMASDTTDLANKVTDSAIETAEKKRMNSGTHLFIYSSDRVTDGCYPSISHIPTIIVY
jgi:hypothetical protein